MTLADIINEGWDIRIYSLLKKKYTNPIYRICWEAKNSSYNLSSEWFGFESAEEAINDLIKKIKKAGSKLNE